MEILGVDIGGSAVKAALVDSRRGVLVGKRLRIKTEIYAEPSNIASIVSNLVNETKYSGPVGCGFPAPIKRHIAYMAANVHKTWFGMDVSAFLEKATGLPFFVLNDADAAGIAEMKFGAGKDCQSGTVLMLTLGTGIGSAIFFDGRLLPNTEFGHMKIRGKDAEKRTSAAIRDEKKLTWKRWAFRLQEYLTEMEKLVFPDLIILGGGISKDADKFLHYLKLDCNVRPACLLNDAGIIGAAMYAQNCVNGHGE